MDNELEEKKVVESRGAPGAVGPYSQAIQAGNMILPQGSYRLTLQLEKFQKDLFQFGSTKPLKIYQQLSVKRVHLLTMS